MIDIMKKYPIGTKVRLTSDMMNDEPRTVQGYKQIGDTKYLIFSEGDSVCVQRVVPENVDEQDGALEEQSKTGKSILVLDTPENCTECPLELDVDGKYNTNICRGCQKYSFNPDSNNKPGWCPLKELPPKLYSEKPVAVYKGWNACIDEILRG